MWVTAYIDIHRISAKHEDVLDARFTMQDNVDEMQFEAGHASFRYPNICYYYLRYANASN
jgi:hypothetical protein